MVRMASLPRARRDREMNKRSAIILSSVGVISIVVTILAVGMLNPAPPQVRGFFPPPAPVTELIVRQQVASAEEATSIVGYEVKTPALPAGYKVRYIAVDKEIGVATILASPQEIQPGVTTVKEFLYDQRGIIVFMEEHDPNFDKIKHMDGWARARNAKPVTVGNYPGAVHEIITIDTPQQYLEQPAEILFYKGNILVELRGMVPASDLIRGAESMT